jgi:hypothetical protein
MARPRLLERNVKLTLVLPPDANRQIRQLAVEEASSASQVIRKIVMDYLRAARNGDGRSA